jgi:hypothetical protein
MLEAHDKSKEDGYFLIFGVEWRNLRASMERRLGHAQEVPIIISKKLAFPCPSITIILML